MRDHTLPISGFEYDSTTFIATFGWGQIHQDGYVEIYADSSDEAYMWMSERYSQKWCSLYGETKGRQQIEEWSYNLVCFADIRSGKEPEIHPVNELILPSSMALHGEIQPIFKTPGEIKIYYHGGCTLDERVEDFGKIVPFLVESGIHVESIEVDCLGFPSYMTIRRAF